MKGSIPKELLKSLYEDRKLSAQEIGKRLKCSATKVNYWLRYFSIQKRSLSEATYVKRNPDGDPFSFKIPTKKQDIFLYGLGLGLYWGEGTKKSKTAIRLGNTDPRLIKKFIEYITSIYGVKNTKFRFGLQIFSDMDPQMALSFWSNYIGFSKKQFGKIIVTPSRGAGTYRHKTRHGVLTVYVSNKKLRDLINSQIERL